MTDAGKNAVVEILKEANSRLGAEVVNLDGLDESTYRRWFGGDHAPTQNAARRAAVALWKQLAEPGHKGARRHILAAILALDPNAPQSWSEQTFAAYFFKLAQTERTGRPRWPLIRKAPRPSDGAMPRAPSRIPAEPLDPQNALHVGVNELFERARFTVSGGFVHLDAETRVHLGPLYAYLTRLQQSAQVANPFVPGRTIPLNDLYVELTAAEDQRNANGESGLGANVATWADRPAADPLGAWRTHAQRHRISLEALVSRTEIQPAVLFGDPGAGKSTLTEYALHELGRGVVDPKGLQAGGALPFRISLREFAVKGLPDEHQVIPYLLREKLGVPADELEDWRMLLSHFFRNERPFRLLLLVDGVDEVTFDTNLFPIIKTRLEDVTAIARIIFTSRRAGFVAPVRSYAAFELVELQEPSIHGLIRNWFSHVHPRPREFGQSFSRWVFGDVRRQEMAGNPCLLSLLCFLNQDCPEDGFIQAVNRAGLYQKAVEKLTSDYDRLGTVPLRASLDDLAGFALDRYINLGAGEAPHVLFTGEEVSAFFHRKAHGSAAVPPATIEPLDLHLDRVWLRTRLVSQWNLGDWYYFIHLSVQEYFAARWLAMMPAPEVGRLIDQHLFNPYWREVWRFYAGLIRGNSTEGQSRFEALATAHVAPRDYYDQTLFCLAPLCAEFGLRDTTAPLGFDLRERLYQLLLEGHNQTRAHIRRMVDVDPEYFLDLTKKVLDSQRARYEHSHPERTGQKIPEVGDVKVAVQILESIYHPEAIRYHQELIRAEVHWSALKGDDPALGPVSPSGRNEPLSEAMSEWLETAAGRLQRERLVSYLACTRGEDAAPAILAAARKEPRLLTKSELSGNERIAAVEFQAHCVWALAELQDVRAVTLAGELWSDPEFRATYVPQVSSLLIDVKHPAVPELLEQWLEEMGEEASRYALEAILEVLKEWPERPVPPVVNALIDDPGSDPSVRASAWEVLVRRGGIGGLQRLRDRLVELADKGERSENEARELVALAGLVGELKLPLEASIEHLLSRFDSSGESFLSDAWGGCLTQCKAAVSRLPSQKQWFCEQCLPELRKALLRSRGGEENHLTNWLHAFRACHMTVLQDLARLMEEIWPQLSEEKQISLLQVFGEMAQFAPPKAVQSAFKSANENLREAAIEILAEVNSGQLIAVRRKDHRADQALRRKSVRDGTLFFDMRYYSPSKLSFETYSPSPNDGSDRRTKSAKGESATPSH